MNSRVIVRSALDFLKPHLERFVRSHGQSIKDQRLANGAHPDTQALLSILLDYWPAVFSKKLGPRDRGLAYELKGARNLWAHEQPVSWDEAYRTIHSVELLLGSMKIPFEAAELERLKAEVRNEQASVKVGRDAPKENAQAPAIWRSVPGGGAEFVGKRLRIAPTVFRSGNPRRPNTHGWLAFEVLRRSEGCVLPFEEYMKRLFNPSQEIDRLAKLIPGVPNAYQDLRHLRHDVRLGRIYVED